MDLPRMYTEFADYWTLISDPADYAAEAAVWKQALRDRLGPGRHTLLELGVGGGNNLSHLTDEFDAVASDLSPQMVEQARALNPGVEFHVGDMRTLRLGRTFDAVLVHDAISYMTSHDDLRAVFATARAHLRPGGVFITGPDWVSEVFQDPYVTHGTNRRGDTTFTTMEYTWDPDPADTTIECVQWFVIRRGGDLRIEQDRHTYGLFPLDTWQQLIVEAGFAFERVIMPSSRTDPRQPCLLTGTLREG